MTHEEAIGAIAYHENRISRSAEEHAALVKLSRREIAKALEVLAQGREVPAWLLHIPNE